jgi:hypothetical protein
VLLVRVRSTPKDDKADEAPCRLIAETLGVAASKARFAAGAKSRLKQVAATGEPGVLTARLSELTRGALFSGVKACFQWLARQFSAAPARGGAARVRRAAIGDGLANLGRGRVKSGRQAPNSVALPKACEMRVS